MFQVSDTPSHIKGIRGKMITAQKLVLTWSPRIAFHIPQPFLKSLFIMKRKSFFKRLGGGKKSKELLFFKNVFKLKKTKKSILLFLAKLSFFIWIPFFFILIQLLPPPENTVTNMLIHYLTTWFLVDISSRDQQNFYWFLLVKDFRPLGQCV